MDKDSRRNEEGQSFAEEAGNLLLITAAPVAWALHFVIVYAAAAVVCANFASAPDAVPLLRAAITVLTFIALAVIGFVAWRSWRQWDFLDDYDYKHERALAEHRHEFLGHASFLLSIISFIGVIYVAMPALLLESCA